MKILVVDDSAEVRRLIREVVQDLADDIHECRDGAEVLEAYAASRPDWVLMDVAMDHMDGLTATRRLRASFPDARIIIVTFHDDPYYRKAAHRAGACGYVGKENLEQIRRLLGESS